MDDYMIVRSSLNGEDDDLESKIEKLSIEEEPLSDLQDSLQVTLSELAQQCPYPVARSNLIVAAKFRERLDRKKDKIPLGVLEVIEELLSTLLFWEATCGVFKMTCNQLDWLALLPWGEYSDVNLDILHAKKVIDENHYILADFKESILETILAAGSSQSDYILCLCGPPEMGKASIGLSIALALNRKFYQFPAGGLSEAEIRGQFTYSDGIPGIMVHCFKSVGTANPVVLIDDIDKLGESDYSDDPVAAMYELLDCRQNENFQDCYLRAPIDLSKVLFVCTATDVEKIPSFLLDLMEVLPFNEDYAKKETQEGGMMQFPEAYEETMLYRNVSLSRNK